MSSVLSNSLIDRHSSPSFSHDPCFLRTEYPKVGCLYEQVMKNDATWTVIDRGGPDFVFYKWGLSGLYGSRRILQRPVRLAERVMERNGTINSSGDSKELLEMVMKQMMYDCVQHLIDCLLPINHVGFDADLAEQFGKALKEVVDLLEGGEHATEVSGNPSKLIERALETFGERAKFDLVEGTTPYDLAVVI